MLELQENKDVVLVLTGCIIPNYNDTVKIRNTKERCAQYKRAIEWYYNNTPYKIVFCDNSGYSLAYDFRNRNDRIEILTYNSGWEGFDRSKGYKEMEILEYVWSNSQYVKHGKLFVKITGRLILLNICKIINYLRNKSVKQMVCSYQNSRKPFSDCKFIFFTNNFWPILLSYKEKIYQSNNFEHITYDAIKEAVAKGIQFIYPPVLDNVDGIGGGSGIIYNKSKLDYFMSNIKHQIRRFLFKIKVLPYIKNEKDSLCIKA